MGVRFRRSVKICKGLKMNVAKTGLSMSVGGSGHSLNFGRGAKATVGIPGTGLSYRTGLASHHKSKSSSKRSTSSSFLPNNIQIKMDPSGKIDLLDSRGAIITEQSVIRRIKATDAYREMVNDLEIQRQEMLQEAFDNAKAENDDFIRIYKLSPQVDDEEHYMQILNSLRAPTYAKKQFGVPCPTEERIKETLEIEAKEVVHGNFLKIGKLRREFVESNLQKRLAAAVADWQKQKNSFDMNESEVEKRETARYLEEFDASKKYMTRLIDGEEQAVTKTLDSWISSCELPVEINIEYEWNQDRGTMCLDVDLPEIEDIPETEVTRLASGNLKEKKKTQATLKEEYITLVFGLAIFISANVFNISPAIKDIMLSGYTQRRDKNGDVNDDYIYSIKFKRDLFEGISFSDIEPKDFCLQFENRCNITSGLIMKAIEPYGMEI